MDEDNNVDEHEIPICWTRPLSNLKTSTVGPLSFRTWLSILGDAASVKDWDDHTQGFGIG